MADDTGNGTLRSKVALGTRTARTSYGPVMLTSTREVAAAANANSQYTMMRIPSNARIHGLSRLSYDDLASTGSPTLDIGLKAVDGNITTDVDALNDGIDCATAAGTANVIKDIANYGKYAWELVAGQATDPGGMLDVIVTILDAATNTGGTITLELMYTQD